MLGSQLIRLLCCRCLRRWLGQPVRREFLAGTLAITGSAVLTLLSLPTSFSGTLKLSKVDLGHPRDAKGNPPALVSDFMARVTGMEVRDVTNAEFVECLAQGVPTPTKCELKPAPDQAFSAALEWTPPVRITSLAPARRISGDPSACERLDLQLAVDERGRLSTTPSWEGKDCRFRAELWFGDPETARLKTDGASLVVGGAPRAPLDSLKFRQVAFAARPGTVVVAQVDSRTVEATRLWPASTRIRVDEISGRLAENVELSSASGQTCKGARSGLVVLAGSDMAILRAVVSFSENSFIEMDLENVASVSMGSVHCAGAANTDLIKTAFGLAGGMFAAWIVLFGMLSLVLRNRCRDPAPKPPDPAGGG